MMGSESDIHFSQKNIWRAWCAFKTGKKKNAEFDFFTYSLEENLSKLYNDLNDNTYTHGLYREFQLTDTKKRTVSVASIRDRVVHRLLYDYLVSIFDRRFIYDAWSCRKGKGLLKAITRTQKFLAHYPRAYVWRTDITKFFDSVDQQVLKNAIRRRISGKQALWLIDEIINGYTSTGAGKGMPIGNLTSQIFCNIYLHELDFYVSHTIKPEVYARYGDDFILIFPDKADLEVMKSKVTLYIQENLKLHVHEDNNIIVPTRRGVHFLGCDIYTNGRRLRKKIFPRIERRLNIANSASYRSLILTHEKKNKVQWIDWQIKDLLYGIA